MELKEYIKIFRDNAKLFFAIVAGVLLLGLLIQFLLPERYKAEVNVDVTRTGQQNETADYRYDEFYRLQADERFADTVVRWLQSKRMQADIVAETRESYFRNLKAMRLSSQLISVNFLVSEPRDAEKVAIATANILNKKAEELNKEQKNQNWFKVIVSKPVVNEYKLPITKSVTVLILLGLFFGFWTVLVRHYLKD